MDETVRKFAGDMHTEHSKVCHKPGDDAKAQQRAAGMRTAIAEQMTILDGAINAMRAYQPSSTVQVLSLQELMRLLATGEAPMRNVGPIEAIVYCPRCLRRAIDATRQLGDMLDDLASLPSEPWIPPANERQ